MKNQKSDARRLTKGKEGSFREQKEVRVVKKKEKIEESWEVAATAKAGEEILVQKTHENVRSKEEFQSKRNLENVDLVAEYFK